MNYADLVEEARIKAAKRFLFKGEVIVEKHSVWIVSPSYEAFIDNNIESRTLYIGLKRFNELNKKLRDMAGEFVSLSFLATGDYIKRIESEKTSAIDSSKISEVKFRG